jgi:hypothetical protein
VCYTSCPKQLPPTGTEVNNKWSYTSTPFKFFHGVNRGKFNLFYLYHINRDKFNCFYLYHINQQIAPVPCIRFQTKLRHSRSCDKSPHTNYTNSSTNRHTQITPTAAQIAPHKLHCSTNRPTQITPTAAQIAPHKLHCSTNRPTQITPKAAQIAPHKLHQQQHKSPHTNYTNSSTNRPKQITPTAAQIAPHNLQQQQHKSPHTNYTNSSTAVSTSSSSVPTINHNETD